VLSWKVSRPVPIGAFCLPVAEDSMPATPITPLGCTASSPFPHISQTEQTNGGTPSAGALAAAISGGSLALPLARGDKHIVLSTTNPARPRVSSMHTKLDHTKIDTSLYQKVGLSNGQFIT